MKLSIEEKLEKAIDFIKSIESLDLPIKPISEIVNATNIYCDNCGEECDFDFSSPSGKYIAIDEIEKLKDRAWHLLVDLTY